MSKTLSLSLICLALFITLPFPVEAEKPVAIPWVSASANIFTDFADKPVVVNAMPYDFAYQFRQRENLLFAAKQFEQIRDKFHWFRTWTLFGWGKKTFNDNGGALLIYEGDKQTDRIPISLSNSEILAKLAEIAKVTLEGDIYDPDFSVYLRSTTRVIERFQGALKAQNIDDTRNILDEMERDYPDNDMLPHMRNSLYQLVKSDTYKLRLAHLRGVAKDLYIVSDMATFYDLLGQWDEKTMFPILMWDDYLVPVFVKKFQPDRVFFAPSSSANVTEQLVWQAMTASLSDNRTADIASADSARYEAARSNAEKLPTGIVFADMLGTGLAAGAMLATGHFQNLLLADLAVQDPAKVISEKDFDVLKRNFEEILDATGLKYREYFDELDYFTLACDIPVGANLFSRYDKQTTAVDDALFRNPDDSRWGMMGRLLGDDAWKLYQANCSLFLPLDSAYFFNTYSLNGTWGEYSTEPMAEAFDEAKIPVENEMTDASLKTWHNRFVKANEASLVYVNSSGGQTNWSIKGGGGSFDDVPLTLPTIVNYNHSGSAGNAYSPNTIAGRWIRNGAFIYYGSYREPLLGAFNPPRVFAAEAMEGYPLSFALRRKMGDSFYTPWKLIYFGDPIYIATLKRTYVNGRDILDKKCLASETCTTVLKRYSSSAEKRLPRDTEALRAAIAASDDAKIQAIIGPCLKYIGGKKKLPPEPTCAFCELVCAYSTFTGDHQTTFWAFEIAKKAGSKLDVISFYLAESLKSLVVLASQKYSKAQPKEIDEALDAVTNLYIPLMSATMPEANAKLVIGRLKLFLTDIKATERMKTVKAALAEAAKGNDTMTKALSALD